MISFSSLFKDENTKKIQALQPIVDKINSLEDRFSGMDTSNLPGVTEDFRKRISEGESLESILPEAFALVREASKRTLGQRHFDVQLMGGIILHEGNIAEMRTGEGKTLVATLPAYLNALTGKGVHIVTVNDYLSRRDAAWMGQIYNVLGLSVACVNHSASFVYDPTHTEKDKERDELGSFRVVHEFLRPVSRPDAYAADITYGTNNEFGFDYLRDNIEYDKKDLRQRGFHFAIVDEIDSILIDEARTPLIISAPTVESENLYEVFAKIASTLTKDEDYEVDEKFKAVTLTDKGIEKAEAKLNIGNIYTDKGIKYVHHLETAVRAKALFKLDKDYVVQDGQVVIVDEFTGRLQPGRRWSEGLHQAMEAKEGVLIQKESRTYASITYQNYFRLYGSLAGMTGTALTSKEEFLKVYGLEVYSVPTNKPIERKDDQDLIFQSEKGKFTAIARRIKELNAKGQPVLIGTVSIENNELLSAFLTKEGVDHTLLNAKNHEKEGEIIAQAGRKGAVTIATNMAGRGVDIKLGGNPTTEELHEEVKGLGGLFVLGTERHEARRIDNQLRGRAGRQGDPGETQFFVSMEDSLMRVFAADTMKKMMGRLGIPEDEPIQNSLITKSLEGSQTKIEGFHFDSRKQVLEYDDVLSRQRKSIYDRRHRVLVGDQEEIEKELSEILADRDDVLTGEVQKKRDALGIDEFTRVIRRLILQTMDMFWVDHLEMMDYLRSSVRLRAYGQRDPLVEYKKEGLALFKEMMISINDEICRIIPNIDVGSFSQEEIKLKETQKQMKLISGSEEGEREAKISPGAKKVEIGRNDACPCGAKKADGTPYKYKHCGLINASHHIS